MIPLFSRWLLLHYRLLAAILIIDYSIPVEMSKRCSCRQKRCNELEGKEEFKLWKKKEKK